MSGPESQSLPAGSKFGVYEVGECIGRGAMGQVYRAEHTLLRRAVALKIMASAARNSTTGHRRFKREARAAAAIKHPNVVDILDMGVLDGLPFIVMELLEGEDLESYLARHGKLSERQLADLALPIIAAIGAVHDAGVVHRDIKPSNIFLAKGGREEALVPKVLDFGISKAAKSLGDTEFVATGPGDLVGTPLYISPEALKGAQYLTPKSDQYSLGVVLYQCAVGRRPHEAKDLARLVRAILSAPIEPLRNIDPSLSPELDNAVMRALSRNPEDRFGDVRDLGAALWSLASQRTRHVWAKRFSVSLAYTLPFGAASAAVPRPKQRDLRPLGAGLAAALAVLTTGYVVSITWPPRRGERPAAPHATVLEQTPALQTAPAASSAPAPDGTALAGAGTESSSGGAGFAVAEATPAAEPAAAAEQAAAAEPAAATATGQEGAGQEAAAPAEPTVSIAAVPAAEPPADAEGSRPAAVPRRPVPRSEPRPVVARAASVPPPRRAALERRAPGVEQEGSALRGREQPVEGERAEPASPPRGANQSPILD